MKNIICEKYKLINIFLFVFILFFLFYMHNHYDSWFRGNEALDFDKYYRGIYSPIFYGGKWLAGILAVLLFFPARFFRIWLLYIAPPILLLTFWLVQGISVHSGNLLNPTRAKMAENGMMLLALITVLFLVTSFIIEWRKKSKLPTA